jgi:t-SNARE complex subunit (syntaxin)
MVECPHCSKLTEFKRLCSHCGGIVIHTVEEKFNLLADSVEKALKKEANKRKNKKAINYFILITLMLVAVVYIGLNMK